MERFNSTLGATAAIVCSLVVAAHLRHGTIEVPPQAPQVAVAATEPWVDPPAALPTAAPVAQLTDGTSDPVPAVQPAVMSGAVAPILPVRISAPPPRPRRAGVVRKHKTLTRAARIHQASAERGRSEAAAAAASNGKAAAQRQGKPDPIGTLIEELDADRGS